MPCTMLKHPHTLQENGTAWRVQTEKAHRAAQAVVLTSFSEQRTVANGRVRAQRLAQPFEEVQTDTDIYGVLPMSQLN